MLIECPFCHTQVKFPDDKEGSKLRCPECSKIYVARPYGARKKSEFNPLPLVLGAGVVLVLTLIWFFVKDREPEAVAKVPEVEEAPLPAQPPLDTSGWDSLPVVTIRDLYESALAYNESKVMRQLDGNKLVDFVNAKALEADPDAEPPTAFAQRNATEKDDFLRRVAADLMDENWEDSPAQWKPFDGRVVEFDGSDALVHIDLAQRTENKAGEAVVSRTMAWKLTLVSDAGQDVWKAWSWERYVSPEEARANRVKRELKYEKVTLSDGSELYQAEPEPLAHLADTPPELARQIDETFARLIDFELHPRENSQALRDVIAFGRPALPVLLTGLYSTKIVDDETAAKVNLIDQALKGITGDDMGYKPHTGLGVSEERRNAAVKAWFAWWWRKGEKRFTERPESVDALDTMIEPTERDKRQIEADKRKAGG